MDIVKAYEDKRASARRQMDADLLAASEGITPEQGETKVVDAVPTGCAGLTDAWIVARAEHEALKAIVEHERNPKPPRPLRDDEAWADMPPKNEAQHNKSSQPGN